MTAAVILAAGQSKRMGRPKLTLPWGDTTVIGRIVDVLLQAGVSPVVVVGGAAIESIETALLERPVHMVFNPRYQEDHMVLSLQAGLEVIPEEVPAVLVVIGDQPQIDPGVVRILIDSASLSNASLILPSYEMRRGHPWLVKRELFSDILAIQPPKTLRDFLIEHAAAIEYLPVDTPSILLDLDTPEDYDSQAPRKKL